MELPLTTEPTRSGRASYLRSRIGRRVVGLFILSALLPLILCAAFLIREFNTELTRTEQNNLDGMTRSFGMTLLGRLGSADDVLKVIASTPGASDASIQDDVERLLWVRSAQRIKVGRPASRTEQSLPSPDARQHSALQGGETVVLLASDLEANPQVFLVRQLPSGALLYIELNSPWLFADAHEYAADASLLVLNERGERINTTMPAENEHAVPSERELRASLATVHASGGARTSTAAEVAGSPSRWMIRSWEVFLRSRFASPSWKLVALRDRPTLWSGSGSMPLLLAVILLTILLITGLSMITIRRQLRPLDLLTRATKRLAQRDFTAFSGLTWDDEFGDLARSFGVMSGRLRMQFAALETLAEVDRILLHSPELELILDTLLPRMAGVLRCASVSVLLFDPDSDDHGRIYDYRTSQTERLPVRRLAADIVALRAACEKSPKLVVAAEAAAKLSCLAPIAGPGDGTVHLLALRHDGHSAGVLCIGYGSERDAHEDTGVGATDFADRLSLILAKLAQNENLQRQAHFDALTGLQNRQLFSDRVATAVSTAQERHAMGALLYIDLDHFKRVNDTAGHDAGDKLLQIVGRRLAEAVSGEVSVARLGGDEFAVLLPAITAPDVARQLAEQVIANVQRPIDIDGREHHVSASVGISVFPTDGERLEDLFKTSDIAMYQAKEAGRGRAVFFQAEMQHRMLERLAMESGLHRALQSSEFKLLYQPIVTGGVRAGLGVEALVRWPGASRSEWMSPGEFVPVAEENGLIVPLGDWILRTACEQFVQWRVEGLYLDYVSVNVSVRQLRESGFVGRVMLALRECGMRAEELQLEITEGVLARGAELAQMLQELASAGVRLALDDFGTGYSSLSYLRNYPIHTVKIDRSFIMGLPQDAAACRLAESIIVMCGALGKHVVAEGVETEAQLAFLRRAGCTSIQGYLFGRPMEAYDIPGFSRRLRSSVEGLVDLPVPAGAQALSSKPDSATTAAA